VPTKCGKYVTDKGDDGEGRIFRVTSEVGHIGVYEWTGDSLLERVRTEEEIWGYDKEHGYNRCSGNLDGREK
jgi:hypothetical protein